MFLGFTDFVTMSHKTYFSSKKYLISKCWAIHKKNEPAKASSLQFDF